jgi:hypothetical protein
VLQKLLDQIERRVQEHAMTSEVCCLERATDGTEIAFYMRVIPVGVRCAIKCEHPAKLVLNAQKYVFVEHSIPFVVRVAIGALRRQINRSTVHHADYGSPFFPLR